jgi:hypothetical protein
MYVMVAEASNFVSNLLNGQNPLGPTGRIVVYRLSDQSHVAVSWIDIDDYTDRGFYWVRNLSTFLSSVSIWPELNPCFEPRGSLK